MAIVWLEALFMTMKNANDTIENGSRDILACSAVPQPTAPFNFYGQVKLSSNTFNVNCFHKSWQKSCTQCSDCEILLNSFNVTYEIYVVTISKHHAMVGHEDTNVMLGAHITIHPRSTCLKYILSKTLL